MAEAPPPHDLNAALPLRGLAPARAHLLRHCTGVFLRLLKVYNPSADQIIAVERHRPPERRRKHPQARKVGRLLFSCPLESGYC